MPFHNMVDDASKLLPLTTKANEAPPVEAEGGASVEIEGNRLLLTAKLTAWDVPPPGVGFTVVTLADPVVAISDAGIDAVSCVALT